MPRQLRGPLRKRNSHLWERHPDDWYIEPEWVDDGLFKVEKFEGWLVDPACGLGRIVQAARRAGIEAVGTDMVQRWDDCRAVCDFLDPVAWAVEPDNIACNPPYGYVTGICEQFVHKALIITRRKVAMLLPSNWIQGEERAAWLAQLPLKAVYFICPRPSMPPGPVIMAGVAPGNGTTDYAWFVWERGHQGPATIGYIMHPVPRAERRNGNKA